MAAAARAFLLSRLSDLPPKPPPAQLLPSSTSPNLFPCRRSFSVTCLSSGGAAGGGGGGGGGNGVSDDFFVSTSKSRLLDRGEGFSVIANMVKKIEPLDNSVISKGVSDASKDSMKQTISTMLGLLPSDHFSVSVTVSKHPLCRLLFSAIITGYTLWNAEYRVSLMRNWDMSCGGERLSDPLSKECGGGGDVDDGKVEELREEDEESGNRDVGEDEGLEFSLRMLGDLSPEALNYIQQLQSELSDMEEVSSILDSFRILA